MKLVRLATWLEMSVCLAPADRQSSAGRHVSGGPLPGYRDHVQTLLRQISDAERELALSVIDSARDLAEKGYLAKSRDLLRSVLRNKLLSVSDLIDFQDHLLLSVAELNTLCRYRKCYSHIVFTEIEEIILCLEADESGPNHLREAADAVEAVVEKL